MDRKAASMSTLAVLLLALAAWGIKTAPPEILLWIWIFGTCGVLWCLFYKVLSRNRR